MPMELLLHYCWKHRLWPPEGLTTTDGQPVEVIDPGLHNRDCGPDFVNAKVKIGGILWAGSIEMHLRSADWYAHGHERDARYDNVVLHVVGAAGRDVCTSAGQQVPQTVLRIPPSVAANYEELLHTDRYLPCYKVVPTLAPLTVRSWLAALQAERLEQKATAIRQRVEQSAGAWEEACFTTLARSFGFGINGDAFEEWARHIPLSAAGKHRDNLFQIEALFMGQAGLLCEESISERSRQAALDDPYFQQLRSEYQFLAHKFSLTPMAHKRWRFFRLRPQNFPYIRIAQLARLYHDGRTGLSALLSCADAAAMADLFRTEATPYWQTHYAFAVTSGTSAKRLSPFSLNGLIINTCVPVLFAYGRHSMRDDLCERALSLMEQLRAERNHIVAMWNDCGLQAQTAADSQALIQLKTAYCDRRECLRCRIGYEYLRRAQQDIT